MTHPHHHQSGATLFELAISIGLCGLVLGVVLSTISMVSAAGVRSHITALEANNTATFAFRTKYRYYPGDLSASAAQSYGFTPRSGDVGHGNGDNIIDGCASESTAIGCENTLFWRDLSQAHLIGAHYDLAADSVVDGSTAGFTISNYVPASPFHIGTQTYVYSIGGRLYYYIAHLTKLDVVGHASFDGGVRPKDAYDLDIKTDDGAPLQGGVRAALNFTQPDSPAHATAEGIRCIVKDTVTEDFNYNQHSNARACQLSIRSSL